MNEVIETIKTYFDSLEWKYDVNTDNESMQTIETGVNARNEKINIRVRVFPSKSRYQILCQPLTTIAPEHLDEAIAAINDFNCSSATVSGCIGNKGNIVFWLGRNTDGDAFSAEAFEADFDDVLSAADFETAQIYKRAYSASRATTKGLFSFLRK